MRHTLLHSLLNALRSAGFRVTTLMFLLFSLALTPRQLRADNHILYVNAHAMGTKDGHSWVNAYTYLQDAIAAAIPGKEIWVAAGVYYPDEGGGQAADNPYSSFLLKHGVAIYGGFAGTELERSQRNPVVNVSVLSGDIDHENDALVDLGKTATGVILDPANIRGTNAFRVVTGDGIDSSAILDGFTINAGFANGPVDTCPDRCGGGIYLEARSPTLANLVITANKAKYGGGMTINQPSTPKLNHLLFSGNQADHGGGIYVFNSNPTLSDVDFSDNHALIGGGGGLYIAYGSPTLNEVDFSGNKALNGDGGGLYNVANSSPSLTHVTFSKNEARRGGGMANNEAGNPTLNNVTFSSNRAHDSSSGMFNHFSNPTFTNDIVYGQGGGIYSSASNLTLTNISFSGNVANDNGGGIYYVSFLQSLAMANITFSGNLAGRNGGGMYNDAGNPTLTNVTFSGNHAASGSGGGIASTGLSTFPNAILFQNAIVWNNTPNNIALGSGASAIYRYSLIHGEEPPGVGNLDGTDPANDPLFIQPVSCGADHICSDDEYGDLGLQAASPAIDVGDNAADLDGNNGFTATVASIATDLDDAPRIVAVKKLPATVDLGAYERAFSPPAAHTGGPYSTSEGGSISLDGSDSSDDIGIVTYGWDCTNDGTIDASAASPTGSTCSFADNGSYTLRLTVTDGVNLSGTATTTLTVANVAPIYSTAPNQSTFSTSAKLFSLGSFTDPGAEGNWSVTIDWGDSSALTQLTVNAAGNLPSKSHTYAAAGTFNVVVKVNDGEADDDGGFQVTVNPLPPGAPLVTAPENQTALVGAEQAINLGSFADPGSSGPWQITVDWGDGSGNTLFNVATAGVLGTKPHIYAAVGSYDVLVTVSDGILASGASFQVVAGADANSGSVAGKVFDDANGNSSQDEGEKGVQGATVTLESSQQSDTVVIALTRTTTSDANGNYRFDNVPAGGYTLTLALPSGYVAVGTTAASLTVVVGQTTTVPSFTLQKEKNEGTLHLPAVSK